VVAERQSNANNPVALSMVEAVTFRNVEQNRMLGRKESLQSVKLGEVDREVESLAITSKVNFNLLSVRSWSVRLVLASWL
jgi:hypothetical protein